MGKGSSTPATTTTINKTEPDPFTQQWRGQVFGAAQNEYNQGMPGYFPGSTVVPFSDQTQAGLNYMQNYAQQGPTGLPQAQGALNRSMSGFNPAMPFARGVANGTGMGMDTLAATSRGDMIGKNPWTDRLAGQVTDRVNAQFMGAGRYGSNAHTEGLASGLSDLYGRVYEGERANQLNAANSLGQFQLGGAGLMGDLYATGNQQGMQAAGMLPGLYNYGLMPADTMMNLGSQYENLAGEYLGDAMGRYNYEQNAGRANVSWLADMMNGLPTYDTQTQTSTAPRQRRSPLAGALGGASGGLGLASMFGKGAAAGPIGWGLAGLGGLIGGFG